jgi:hypothetical protein
MPSGVKKGCYKECNKTFAENMEGTLVTESHFVEQQAFVIPKSDK